MSVPTTAPPDAVSWNLTQRCNLSCAHCYLDANARAGAADPSTDDCLRIVEQLAEVNPRLLLILTGGEPLLRPDLTQISRAGSDAGMTVVVGTNGTLLDAAAAAQLRENGVSGVGISVDAATTPALHDRLRGKQGSWEEAVASMRVCKEAGLEFLVQTSVFAWNRQELPAVAQLAADHGARSWNVYFLVCTGRGQELTDLSAHEYEDALREVRALQRTFADRLLVAVRCAPQYRRVVAEDPEPGLSFNAYDSGCPAAFHYARIGPSGEVTPCPYMPSEAGRLAEQSFAEIWSASPLLMSLRDRSGLEGKCGACSYRDSCGGCRARALATHGRMMAEDPSCAHDPAAAAAVPGIAAAPPVPEPTFALPTECTMPWSDAAVARLDRVPSFLRGLVIRRVEEEARKRGAEQVVPEIMQDVRGRMMPGNSAPMRAAASVASAPSGELTWTPEALGRLANAPDFVRPGILKLMKLRAGQHGRNVVTSEFLSEIRDESMMRVSKIMRKFGLGELRPEAFTEARRRMAHQENKLIVLDQIEAFLRNRTSHNQEIRDKFQMFLDKAAQPGPLWMPDAESRLASIPQPRRAAARRAAEETAKRRKMPVVTRGVVDMVWDQQSNADR